jgi:hypothetical protein
VATATVAIVVLPPPPLHFYHCRRPKFNFQPLSFTFETFGKKLAETKILFIVKKIKAKKNRKKAFKSPEIKRQQFFTKIC